MTVKVTYKFRVNGTGPKPFGFTESHFFTGAAPSLLSVVPKAVELGNARIALCGANVQLNSARLSLVGSPRATFTYFSTAGGNSGSTLQGTGGMAGLNSDQANACLQIVLNGPNNYKGGIFMAGIPDDVIVVGTVPGPSFAGAPGFLAKFNAWRDALTADGVWGFKARTPTVASPINFWSQEGAAPFRLILQYTSPPDNGVPGDIIQVRGVRNNIPRTPNANGQWRIGTKAVAGSFISYLLLNSQGLQASDIFALGTVESVVYGFQTIMGVGVAGQTTRRRGVGPDRPRGRSSRRRRSMV